MKSLGLGAVLGLLLVCGEARKCQNLTVPVTISARNGAFNVPAPGNNIAAENFILGLTQPGKNFSQELLTGYNTVSGNYSIAATYCEPDAGPARDVVQLLTHGIAFDRSYWDLSINDYNYSYIEATVDSLRLPTFSWDRLGIGMSQHGDPVDEIQVYLEVAALRALTQKLREGSIPGVGARFGKVVHVGHSFGSVQSYALAALYPAESDGLVLTGFSGNGTFIPYFAHAGNFVVANGLPSLLAYPPGYLASSDLSAVQANFFVPGNFDPDVLALAYETGQPVTVGELLTISNIDPPTANFSGPVLVVTGERDIPFCGGNCLAIGNPDLPSIPAALKLGLPNVSDFQAVIIPRASHSLNLEFAHTATYNAISKFLSQWC